MSELVEPLAVVLLSAPPPIDPLSLRLLLPMPLKKELAPVPLAPRRLRALPMRGASEAAEAEAAVGTTAVAGTCCCWTAPPGADDGEAAVGDSAEAVGLSAEALALGGGGAEREAEIALLGTTVTVGGRGPPNVCCCRPAAAAGLADPDTCWAEEEPTVLRRVVASVGVALSAPSASSAPTTATAGTDTPVPSAATSSAAVAVAAAAASRRRCWRTSSQEPQEQSES